MKNEVKHTAHSSYRCEYHLVFAPKYRRKVIYKAVRRDIIEIIKKLCKEMKVEIIEGEACPDHIHLLVCFTRLTVWPPLWKKRPAAKSAAAHPKGC